MRIEWDVPIEMDDGVTLRADVFRPDGPGPHPVIMTQGVYGKGLPIARFRQQLQGFATQVRGEAGGADLADTAPAGGDHVAEGDFRVWEVPDPDDWVPAGYACVRVDSRGAGASEGRLDPLSPREIQDYEACIEWAGTQEWSNGRVGLCGKSYLAMTQWLVAARKPPHLAAICVWHGESDWYRDATRHGGILYQFWERFWYPYLVLPVQHGRAAAGTNPHSGHPVAGSGDLTEAQLEAARVDLVGDLRAHPFDDDYFAARTPDLARVEVPLLASADWSDHDLHERGTIRGYQQASSARKWLEIHDGGQFDDPDSVALQRRFFDSVLKGEGDWDDQPPVQLAVRRADGSHVVRFVEAWPLPQTTWTTLHLDPAKSALTAGPPSESVSSYATTGDGLVLLSEPFDGTTTLLGPIAASLAVSSSTADADLFLVLEAIGPDGRTIEVRDHRGGVTPLSVGWQRVSHRELDPERSEPWAPFHTHRSAQPLEVDEVVEVQVELRPAALELPAGARLSLRISGRGAAHDDPVDRPTALFDGTVRIHAGPDRASSLLLPIVPTASLAVL